MHASAEGGKMSPRSQPRRERRALPVRPAFTLTELLVVTVILVVLAGLAVPLFSDTADNARETVTLASMTQMSDVILGPYRRDNEKRLPRPGYFAQHNPSLRGNFPQVRYLFINPGPVTAPGMPETVLTTYDPVARKGWRGPYLQNSAGKYRVDLSRNFTQTFGENDDPAVLDGWGHPIVIVEAAGVDGLMHAELRSAGKDGVLLTGDDLFLPLY